MEPDAINELEATGCHSWTIAHSNSSLIDGASVKRSLLRNGLKLNFHRYIGQLRRPLPRLQKTGKRRFIAHMCCACMYDD